MKQTRPQHLSLQSRSAALCMITALREDKHDAIDAAETRDFALEAEYMALKELRKYIKNGCSPGQKQQLLQVLEQSLKFIEVVNMTTEREAFVRGVFGLIELYKEQR